MGNDLEQEQQRTKQVREDVRIFEELFTFMRESTGLAIAIGYIVLLLLSLSYLYSFYSVFDISITKFITFEDMLAAPIRNPKIIFSLFFIIALSWAVDWSNAYRRKLLKQYVGKPRPFYVKLMIYIFWSPKKRKTNITFTLSTVLLGLFSYAHAFAYYEGEGIKTGKGALVELELVDSSDKVIAALLGTSTNYVFTYDQTQKESVLYFVESIKSIKPLSKPIHSENNNQEESPEPLESENGKNSDT